MTPYPPPPPHPIRHLMQIQHYTPVGSDWWAAIRCFNPKLWIRTRGKRSEERGRQSLAVIVHLWARRGGMMRLKLLPPRWWSCWWSDDLSLMHAYWMQVWWRPNVRSTLGAREHRSAHHAVVARSGAWWKLGNRKGGNNLHHGIPTKIALSVASSLFPSFFPSSCFDGSFCLPHSSSESRDVLHLCSVGDYNSLTEIKD